MGRSGQCCQNGSRPFVGKYPLMGWREATGAGWGGSRINEGLRGLMKADSLAA